MKLSADTQSKIETLVLFIGYPRSGTTLIGSLLDAHPHVVVANELDIFERWTEWTNEERTRENLFNKLYDNSYKQAVLKTGYRSTAKKSGRSYAVPNQWQGKYKDYIKVSCPLSPLKLNSFSKTQLFNLAIDKNIGYMIRKELMLFPILQ